MEREKLKEYLIRKYDNNIHLKKFCFTLITDGYMEELLEKTKFLNKYENRDTKNNKITIRERIFCILNNLDDRPTCPVCKENKCNFNIEKKRFALCCSNGKCIYQITSERVKDKYGVCNISSTEGMKNLKREIYNNKTDEEKEEIGKVREERCIEKYGVKNISQLDWVQDKKDQTNLLKRGVVNPSQDPKVWDKIVETWTKKYNVDNISKDPNIKKKKVITGIRKEFKFPSGKTVIVQGCEPTILSALLEMGIPENDIYPHSINLKYSDKNNKNRVWMSDIYLKSSNTLIEAKSSYILKKYDQEGTLAYKISAGNKEGFNSIVLLHTAKSIFKMELNDLNRNKWILSFFYGCRKKDLIGTILELEECGLEIELSDELKLFSNNKG